MIKQMGGKIVFTRGPYEDVSESPIIAPIMAVIIGIR